MKGCGVPDCTRVHMARGYCQLHYTRLWTKEKREVVAGSTFYEQKLVRVNVPGWGVKVAP